MKILKSRQRNFAKQANAIILNHGAESVSKSAHDYQYKLNTVFGVLNIRIDQDCSIMFSVFMKFETFSGPFYEFFSNQEINSFSYKWNLHSSDDDYILNELEERFSNLDYANKVIRISDALNESIATVSGWEEEKINRVFLDIHKEQKAND